MALALIVSNVTWVTTAPEEKTKWPATKILYLQWALTILHSAFATVDTLGSTTLCVKPVLRVRGAGQEFEITAPSTPGQMKIPVFSATVHARVDIQARMEGRVRLAHKDSTRISAEVKPAQRAIQEQVRL
jgi:hypothetical protein